MSNDLMGALIARAEAEFGGHLTIMRFTTNWRVGFVTPNDRWMISVMPVGKTFKGAAENALAQPSEFFKEDIYGLAEAAERAFLEDIEAANRSAFEEWSAAHPDKPLPEHGKEFARWMLGHVTEHLATMKPGGAA
jgi:hypothetical protein